MNRTERLNAVMASGIGRHIKEEIKQIIQERYEGNRKLFSFSDYFFRSILPGYPNHFEMQDRTALNNMLKEIGILPPVRGKKPKPAAPPLESLYTKEEVRLLVKLRRDGII